MREAEKSSVIVAERDAPAAAGAVAASFWDDYLPLSLAHTDDFPSHIVTDVISWTAEVSLSLSLSLSLSGPDC